MRRTFPRLSLLVVTVGLIWAASMPAAFAGGPLAKAPSGLSASKERPSQSSRSTMLVDLSPGVTRTTLATQGLTLVGPGVRGGWRVTGTHRDLQQAKRSGLIAELAPMSIAAKVDRRLRDSGAGQAGLGADDLDGAAIIGPVSESSVQALVYVDPHVSLFDAAEEMARFKGIQIHGVAESVGVIAVSGTPRQLLDLGAFSYVHYIAQPDPKYGESTNAIRHVTGVDAAHNAGSSSGLNGTGVSVLIYESSSMPNAQHVAFSGQEPGNSNFGGRLIPLDSGPLTAHGTAVAGILGGGGGGSLGRVYKGIAPNVAMVSRISNGFAFFQDICDIEHDYYDAIDDYGMVIANNSLNQQVCSTSSFPLPMPPLGAYDCTSQFIDMVSRGNDIEGKPSRHPVVSVWSAGNQRGYARCEGGTPPLAPQGYGTIAAPATSKNCIAVGNVFANTLSPVPDSSFGPTSDGRLKPDLVAPGDQSGPVSGVVYGGLDANGSYNKTTYPTASTSAFTSYVSGFGGTSSAAPVVAGASALLYQAYRELHGPTSIMQPALVKALLCHTAQDLGFVGPDYATGFGLVRVDAAVEALRDLRWYEGDINENDEVVLRIEVASGADELRVTLAWDDPPGAPCVTECDCTDGIPGQWLSGCNDPKLINNLDIAVRLSGTPANWWGPWKLNSAAPAQAATRQAPQATAATLDRDTRNNIEQVVIDAPTPGIYEIVVSGTTLPMGPQRFAIVASPSLRACSDTLEARLDAEVYGLQGLVQVTLRNCDLDSNDSVPDTVSVLVVSDFPDQLSVTLTETGASTGVFQGVVQLSPSASQSTLRVQDGSTLVVSVAGTPVASASVDGVAPILEEVPGSPPLPPVRVRSPSRIFVEFLSDEPAFVDCLLSYGPGVGGGAPCGVPVRVVRGARTGLEQVIGGQTKYLHQFSIDELPPNEEVYVSLRATDFAGNTSILDNNGACYIVQTPSQEFFATEHFRLTGFNAGPRPFDLVGQSIEFIPTQVGNDPVRYTMRRRDIDSLPVDPTGDLVIFEDTAGGNDRSLEVDFESDSMSTPLFQFFGAAYSSVYIGSNGYVTFGQGDTSVPTTLAGHFNRPRISALAADLDASRGGTLSYLQMNDRFVVTWENVPRQSMVDSNTFQIELHYTGKIVVSWIETSVTDTIVGLSDGNGTPMSFVPADLSSVRTEGFFPPVAESRLYRTATGTPIDIQLSATDDGHPFGVIVYRITSLPQHGQLLDASAYPLVQITSGQLPYTIASGGARFLPPNDAWNGRVEFNFVADDLGESLNTIDDETPNGGSSAPAGSVGASGEAVVVIECGVRTRIHSYLVADSFNASGWSGFSTGGWEYGQPLGMGALGVDPTSGFTGNNVIGFNLAGDYPDQMPATHLVSPPLDLTGVTGARVSFRRWLGVVAGDSAEFAISVDGVTWVPQYAVSAESVRDRQWRRREYDISKWADGESTVYLRWTMGPSGIIGESFGWNIDDIVIEGMRPRPCCPGDVNGSGTVTVQDIFALITQPFGPVDAPNIYDINGDGMISTEDIQVISANLGVDCSGCN